MFANGRSWHMSRSSDSANYLRGTSCEGYGVKFACLIFCFLYIDFCYLVTVFPFPLLFANPQRDFGK